MGTQNGSKLEIRHERILIHTLELEVRYFEVFPFTPMHYVMGMVMHTHECDDFYPICSKLQQHYVVIYGQFFCLVCTTSLKNKTDLWYDTIKEMLHY